MSFAVHRLREELDHEFFALEHPDRGYVRARERVVVERRAELLASSVVAVFPWRRCAVHLPDPETYFRLRTSRNRQLVTDDEQRCFRDGAVAVGGLSVGFSILHNLVLGGGPRHVRIADFDRLSVPNLNRLAHSVTEIGVRKTRLAARRVYELEARRERHPELRLCRRMPERVQCSVERERVPPRGHLRPRQDAPGDAG